MQKKRSEKLPTNKHINSGHPDAIKSDNNFKYWINFVITMAIIAKISIWIWSNWLNQFLSYRNSSIDLSWLVVNWCKSMRLNLAHDIRSCLLSQNGKYTNKMKQKKKVNIENNNPFVPFFKTFFGKMHSSIVFGFNCEIFSRFRFVQTSAISKEMQEMCQLHYSILVK